MHSSHDRRVCSTAHYNYYRDYDPSIERYVESDPLGLVAGPNTYAYVRNSALVRFDAYGLVASGYDNDPYPRCGIDPSCRAGLTRPPKEPFPPSCFDSCMLRKLGWQAIKSFSFRTALAAAASQSVSVAAWGYAGSVAIGRAVPYAAPFFVYHWVRECIDECDTCRDSGNKAFSYP